MQAPFLYPAILSASWDRKLKIWTDATTYLPWTQLIVKLLFIVLTLLTPDKNLISTTVPGWYWYISSGKRWDFTKKKQLRGRQQRLIPTIRKGPWNPLPMFYRLLSLGWAPRQIHVDKDHFEGNQKICALSKGDSVQVPLCSQQCCKMRSQSKVNLYTKGKTSATGMFSPVPLRRVRWPWATWVIKAFFTSTISLRLRGSCWFGPSPLTPL